MKRLLGLVVVVVSFASILSCMIVLAAWLRSYWVCDWYGRLNAQGNADFVDQTKSLIVNFRGVVEVGWSRVTAIETRTQPRLRAAGTPNLTWDERLHYPPRNADVSTGAGLLGRLGFRADVMKTDVYDARISYTIFQAPHWFLCLLTASPAVAIRMRWRRERTRQKRREQGLCVRCGYDLRASPGLCPECGHEPTPLPLTVQT